jgi:hypothetical protein
MDSYHRQTPRNEQPTGRDCRFCAELDPNFTKRNPMDRWVQGNPQDSAISHLSENGHVMHLMFEIARRKTKTQEANELAKTA